MNLSASEDDAIYMQKSDRKNRAKAVLIFLLCLFAVLLATVIKFALIEKVRTEFPFVTYLCLSAAIACIFSAQLVNMLASRSNLIAKPKAFAAVYTAMTVAYIANLYLEMIHVYLMPVCLAAFVIAPLSKRRDAFSGNLFVNILLCFVLVTQNILTGQNNYFAVLTMFVMGILSGTVAAYWVANDTKRLNYVLKGLAIGLFSAALIFVLMMLFEKQPYEYVRVSSYMSIGLAAQVLFAFLAQPVFESSFNLVTNNRLVELTDHNSPLIRRLIAEAPGTFNHSLAVANFAEMCASAIGENPYLARACAYYHDVGKLVNPHYFKENQADYNPHDELLPEISADIIRSHTTEGLRLCEAFRIPGEVAEVTIQHHGTLPIYVFFNKAKQLTDGEVPLADYCYRGEKPVSKVAAIIMLCDSSEAAIRAMTNPDGERVDALLKKLITDRIEGGQFTACDISLSDLDKIRQTIISAFGGQFHKRLVYPDGDKK